MKLHAEFEIENPFAALLLVQMLQGMSGAQMLEVGDEMRAVYQTKTKTTRIELQLADGKLQMRFKGPRRALNEGVESLRIMVADPTPWINGGRAVFTARTEGTELSLWGEVIDASTSTPKVPL